VALKHKAAMPTHTLSCSIQYSTIQIVGVHLEYLPEHHIHTSCGRTSGDHIHTHTHTLAHTRTHTHTQLQDKRAESEVQNPRWIVEACSTPIGAFRKKKQTLREHTNRHAHARAQQTRQTGSSQGHASVRRTHGALRLGGLGTVLSRGPGCKSTTFDVIGVGRRGYLVLLRCVCVCACA
jgi:hypothetical protein